MLAALLHDIGQFSTAADQMLCDADSVEGGETGESKKKISVGVKGHERIGAELLRNFGFSEKVAQLVESHVPVKRYLTGKDASYYESLSGASKLSLKYQVSKSIIKWRKSACQTRLAYTHAIFPLFILRAALSLLNKLLNLKKIHSTNKKSNFVVGTTRPKWSILKCLT